MCLFCCLSTHVPNHPSPNFTCHPLTRNREQTKTRLLSVACFENLGPLMRFLLFPKSLILSSLQPGHFSLGKLSFISAVSSSFLDCFCPGPFSLDSRYIHLTGLPGCSLTAFQGSSSFHQTQFPLFSLFSVLLISSKVFSDCLFLVIFNSSCQVEEASASSA